jgi:hypothetical protein
VPDAGKKLVFGIPVLRSVCVGGRTAERLLLRCAAFPFPIFRVNIAATVEKVKRVPADVVQMPPNQIKITIMLDVKTGSVIPSFVIVSFRCRETEKVFNGQFSRKFAPIERVASASSPFSMRLRTSASLPVTETHWSP